MLNPLCLRNPFFIRLVMGSCQPHFFETKTTCVHLMRTRRVDGSDLPPAACLLWLCGVSYEKPPWRGVRGGAVGVISGFNPPSPSGVTPGDPWKASPQQKGPKGATAGRMEIKTEPEKCAAAANLGSLQGCQTSASSVVK